MTTITKWVLERTDLKHGPAWYRQDRDGRGDWTSNIHEALMWATQQGVKESDALAAITAAGEPRVFIRPWTTGSGGGGAAGGGPATATFGQFTTGERSRPLGWRFTVQEAEHGGFIVYADAGLKDQDTPSYAFSDADHLLAFLRAMLPTKRSIDPSVIAAKD